MGRCDVLAQSMGQPYVHLGMNMAATAIPDDSHAGGPPEEVIIWFGIIDILQVCIAHSLTETPSHAIRYLVRIAHLRNL